MQLHDVAGCQKALHPFRSNRSMLALAIFGEWLRESHEECLHHHAEWTFIHDADCFIEHRCLPDWYFPAYCPYCERDDITSEHVHFWQDELRTYLVFGQTCKENGQSERVI